MHTINTYLFVAYIVITVALFAIALWSEYKWIPLIMAFIMAAVTITSAFVPETPIEDIVNWITICFWISLALAFGFGSYFSVYTKKAWAGLIAGVAIVALIVLTLVDMLLYGVFPLIPGANISIISMLSLSSIGAIGIIAGKSASDHKRGLCIPFLENCSKYNCDDASKCYKK